MAFNIPCKSADQIPVWFPTVHCRPRQGGRRAGLVGVARSARSTGASRVQQSNAGASRVQQSNLEGHQSNLGASRVQ